MNNAVYIVDAVRTPRARRKGKYSAVHPVDLLALPLRAVVERQKLDPAKVEDVLVGCVTQITEQGWCIARRGALAAGFPIHVPGVTINRLCGSGQQAVNFAAALVASGNAEVLIAGGVEHMTRVPMFSDCGGEESPLIQTLYPHLVSQGEAAELVAVKYGLSRERIDDFAAGSQHRAAVALSEGRFAKSLVQVSYTDQNGVVQMLEQDDTVREGTTLAALAALKPAFRPDGVITAGNASAIVDGAAAVLIAGESAVEGLSLTPRARVVASYVVGSDPLLMLTGPIAASEGVLRKANLKVESIDVWEINEAFAPIPLIAIDALGLDPAKVNVNGGGISLGHPLGATGAMLVGAAVDELERINGKYAVVTMCIGLGMGIATVLERV